jgi:hypothetical protein
MSKGMQQTMTVLTSMTAGILTVQKKIVPTAFFGDMEGTIFKIEMFDIPEDKSKAVMHIAKLARQCEAESVFLVMEAFYLVREKDDGDDYPLPSKHPDRKECVSLMGKNKKGVIVSGMVFFSRNTDGDIIIEDTKIDDGKASSWWLDEII